VFAKGGRDPGTGRRATREMERRMRGGERKRDPDLQIPHGLTEGVATSLMIRKLTDQHTGNLG
jgi:hypothetical protein